MPNRQTQDQQNRGKRKPDAFPPDQEDGQEDVEGTGAEQNLNVDQRGGKRSAQQNTAADTADEDVDDVEDTDEVEEDDDEEDGAGGRV